MLLRRIIYSNGSRVGTVFSALMSGVFIMSCAAQGATFACEMPDSPEAGQLCNAVDSALSGTLGGPLVRVEAKADYLLVIQHAKPTRIIARLDAFGQEGPKLGLGVMDRSSVPADAIAKFAHDLVEGLK